MILNYSRKCIVSGSILPVEKLLRVAKLKDGTFEVAKNKGGRGAYIRLDLSDAQIEKMFRKQTLNRVFRTIVPKETYLEIKRRIEDGR